MNNMKNDFSKIKIDKSKLKLVSNRIEESEEISGVSLGYWKDSFRRLLHNKIATISLILIGFIFIFSIFITSTTPHSTVIEPQIKDPDTGQMISKKSLTSVPPRIKGLEWLGWFDGRVDKLLPKIALENEVKYPKDTYEIVECEEGNTGKEMCTIDLDVYKQNGIEQLYFTFGTDQLARDNWTRVWAGVRNSLAIGLLAAVFDIVMGVIYGSICGFYGGTKVDNIMMRFIEIYGSIPSIVLLILLLSFMDRGFGALIIALGLTGWIGVARMVRAQYLRYREHDFVLASRTIGASTKRLIFKHIFPNIIGQIVILATFSIPAAIFYEASLSFIGLGLPTDQASLGTLINNGITQRSVSAYLLWIPTIVLSIVMLAINLLANGLRDALDPRLRGR